MAYENINIVNSNFCIGPQAGTICTIDLSNPRTILRVINTSGSAVMSLTLSSNILSSDVRLEYIGPNNLSGMVDELTFFTFEKVNDNTCMIKRWETRMAYMELSLKEQVVKSSTGDLMVNALDFAVEHHKKSFNRPNEKYNYLHVDDVEYIKSGTKLILGPSTDPTNTGAMETVFVSSVASDIDGYRLNLTSYIQNEYSTGDSVMFYNYVYIYSSEGYGGDLSKGSLIKIDAYNWQVTGVDVKAFYKRVTSSRWCLQTNSIASIIDTNMFFVQPYNEYTNWRSMFMNNVENDEYTTFRVYDVAFDNYTIYRLQDRISLRSGAGDRLVYTWNFYNFQQDTLLPYSDTISVRLDSPIITGYNKEVNVYANVRDQFHIGLRDITVTFSVDGDQEAELYPLNGITITDTNGESSIKYTSGFDYTGRTIIGAQGNGSSSFTGSQYVWGGNSVYSTIDINNQSAKLIQKLTAATEYSATQISLNYKIIVPDTAEAVLPFTSIFCKTFFTNPGGDWGNNLVFGTGTWIGPDKVRDWLPMLYLGDGIQVDSPAGGDGMGFEDSGDENSFDLITQVDDYTAALNLKLMSYFLSFSNVPEYGEYPRISIVHPDEEGSTQFSQMKMGVHSYWVDGVYSDDLWTYVKTNQFVFVQEAVPAFWSEKNAIDTTIWIRLRPFAFSLNPSAFKMYIREISHIGDTGYYNVTDSTLVTTFDAGSSLLGIEALCTPPTAFLHGARVFVRVEVYDTASSPNFVYVEYWFDIIPDFKAPYLTNLLPDRESSNVSINSDVYFEIKDDGSGIDINSLECFINSIRMLPDLLSIERVSMFHYKVTYTPPEPLYFDKTYKILVKVNDTSEYANRMNYSYKFYTASSSGVVIIDHQPRPCSRGTDRFEDVQLKLLAAGNGIDIDSLRLQVFNKDVHPNVVPIIYRVS